MPTHLVVPPATSVSRSESLRSDASKKVSFRRGVDVRRYRGGSREREPQTSGRPVLIYREDPPSSEAELDRQAEDIIRQLDNIDCDVSTTPYPVRNGLPNPAVSRQPGPTSRASSNAGSLDRVALKLRKNNQNRASNANTLPPPVKNRDIDSDKNNLIKAESLKRGGKRGEVNKLKVNGYLKQNSQSVDHLNNVNILQGSKDMSSRYNNQRRGSVTHLVNGDYESDSKPIANGKYFSGKFSDAPDFKSNRDGKRLSSDRETSPKVADSFSQTPSGFGGKANGSDVIYTQVMVDKNANISRNRFSPEPPERPARPPAHYTPRGFSYISKKDAELIGRRNSIEDRSRYIIEKIASERSRSRSPDYKPPWSPQRLREYSRTPSPPPAPIPPPSHSRTYRETYHRSYHDDPPHLYRDDPPRYLDDPPRIYREEPPEVRRGRYGSSIVMIGGEEPPETVSSFGRTYNHTVERDFSSERTSYGGTSRLTTLRENSDQPHYMSPRSSEHYSVPRKVPASARDGDNVIRLSVSGSHSSSNYDSSPTQNRRITTRTYTSSGYRGGDPEPRRSHSHEPTPPRQVRDHRSKSNSPERLLNDDGRRRANNETSTTRRTVTKTSETTQRRRGSRESSSEHSSRRARPPEVNGHVTREVKVSGTLEKARRRLERDRAAERGHVSGDKKKKIKIKFMYDDTKDEPSDVRLAKYVEYKGSDSAESPSPPLDRHRPDRDDVDLDIREEERVKQDKIMRQREKFLSHFLEQERPEDSERRDGRKISPGQQSYDKDLHGVWSSLDEEDQVAAGHHRSEKVTTKRSTVNLKNNLYDERDKKRPSVSSEDDKNSRQRSRERSSSPERSEKKKGWLSSTLSRLDIRSKKSSSQSPSRTTSKAGSVSRGGSRVTSSQERREQRSTSRDSRSGSQEPTRRAPGRTPSFSQRYFGESDVPSSSESPGRRPAGVRRASSNAVSGGGTVSSHRRHQQHRRGASGSPQRAGPSQSLTSSVNSSGSEAGSQSHLTSRVSNSSNRSVFLHATTVADIPSPESPELRQRSGSRDDLDSPLPSRERRKVSRSFSLISPFRPKHMKDKEIKYENQERGVSGQVVNGRPPRPPQRQRRGSRDSLLDERAQKNRKPVSRSASMPKDPRSAGWYKSKERPTPAGTAR